MDKLEYTPEEESYALCKILLEIGLSGQGSRCRWAILNNGRTYEEMISSEVALKRYRDACIALGYTPQEHKRINEALNCGQIPSDVVATALICEADCFSGDDLLAINKGYPDDALLEKAKFKLSEGLLLA